MSALVELTADLKAIAKRLGDPTTGDGARLLQSNYIDPTVRQIERVAANAFGADRKPFKNKNYAVTVAAKIVKTPTGCEIVFQLGPTGFWVFGEYGAGAHDIRPRRTGGRLASHTHPHPTRGPVHHPGSHGKRAISRASAVIRKGQHAAVQAWADNAVTHG